MGVSFWCGRKQRTSNVQLPPYGGHWTFVLAFPPTYPGLPAFTCLHRHHTQLNSIEPRSLSPSIFSCQTLRLSCNPQAKRSPGSSSSPRRRPIQAGAKKTRVSTIRACVHICAESFVQFDLFKSHKALTVQDIKIFHNSGTPHFECTD